MGLSDSEVSRLLAGEVPTDDPGVPEVAAFLSDLRASCPPAPVDDAVRRAHLAAILQEAGRVAAERSSRRRRGAPRAVLVVVAAAVSLLTAGVGVATALGGNPLELLPGLR
ncbi:MAG: hypothetical protein AAGC63_15815, partial [Propionicimonas sp.]